MVLHLLVQVPGAKAGRLGNRLSGGHILSFNVESGEFVDYGVPMPGASWPSSRLDQRRRMLYAAGFYNEFLAWDVDARRPNHAGHLPAGMTWSNRVMLIDPMTGMVYTCMIMRRIPARISSSMTPSGIVFSSLTRPCRPTKSARSMRLHSCVRAALAAVPTACSME